MNSETLVRRSAGDSPFDKDANKAAFARSEGLLSIARVVVGPEVVQLVVGPKCGMFAARGLRIAKEGRVEILSAACGVREVLDLSFTRIVNEKLGIESGVAGGLDTALVLEDLPFSNEVMLTSICPLVLRLRGFEAEQEFSGVLIGDWVGCR